MEYGYDNIVGGPNGPFDGKDLFGDDACEIDDGDKKRYGSRRGSMVEEEATMKTTHNFPNVGSIFGDISERKNCYFFGFYYTGFEQNRTRNYIFMNSI